MNPFPLRITLAQALREQKVNLNTWKFHELTEQWPWLGESYQGATCPIHHALILRTNLDWILHVHDEHPEFLLVQAAGMEALLQDPELEPIPARHKTSGGRVSPRMHSAPPAKLAVQSSI